MLINNTFIQREKSRTRHTGRQEDFFGEDITFRKKVTRKTPSDRSLTSQVTLWKQNKLKKQQIKNSFVECLVTFTVYHRFLPWFE